MEQGIQRRPNPLLRQARQQRFWTLVDLATEISKLPGFGSGLPDSYTISRWERGISFPSPRYCRALCTVFQKEARELGLTAFPQEEIDQAHSLSHMGSRTPEIPLLVREEVQALSSRHLCTCADLQAISEGQRETLPPHLGQCASTTPKAPAQPTEDTLLRACLPPFPPRRLIGREAEQEHVCALLLSPGMRLVTLTGPGGVGKTVLALAVAQVLYPAFADGITFVDLSAIHSPALVMPTIASQLGIKADMGARLLEHITTLIGLQHRLVVLDNFEQVLEASAHLVALLQVCPKLSLLVTSRERLAVRWEREFVLSPLPLPPVSQIAGGAELADNPSVALFVERARQHQPDFCLVEENRHDVAAVCRRLEGLPLALELAAARMRLLSPRSLLSRLGACLPILTRGGSDLPKRHRTLRATIAWSYSLLSPGEQRLFRLLSVFVGGCTLTCIESLLCVLGEDESTVLDTVSSLLDKSLIGCKRQGEEDPRITMLETIREFGWEQLQMCLELDQVRLAHARLFDRMVQEAAEQQAGPLQEIWCQRLEADLGNLRAVLDFALIQHIDVGVRVARLPTLFWFMRGHTHEIEHWLSRALSQREHLSPLQLLQVLGGLADAAQHHADSRQAEELGQRCLSLARQLSDQTAEASALFALGRAAWLKGAYQQAHVLYSECLNIFKRLGDWMGEGATRFRLSTLTLHEGDYQAARTHAQAFVTLCLEHKSTLLLSKAVLVLLDVLLTQGAYKEASLVLQQALQDARAAKAEETVLYLQYYQALLLVAQEAGLAEAHQLISVVEHVASERNFLIQIFEMQLALGQIALLQGEVETARRWARKSQQVVARMEARHYQGQAHLFEVWLALSGGEIQEAHAHLSEHLKQISKEGKGLDEANCLDAYAYLAACEGEPLLAVQMWGTASAMRTQMGGVLWPLEQRLHDQAVDAVRATLDKQRFVAAWEKGRLLQPLSFSQGLSGYGSKAG